MVETLAKDQKLLFGTKVKFFFAVFFLKGLKRTDKKENEESSCKSRYNMTFCDLIFKRAIPNFILNKYFYLLFVFQSPKMRS